MFRKILALVCVVSILFQDGALFFSTANAAGSVSVTTFRVSKPGVSNSTSSLLLNPDDTFNIEFTGKNNGGTTLTGAFIHTWFSDNNPFELTGTGQDFYDSSFSYIYNPVPAAQYDTVNGLKLFGTNNPTYNFPNNKSLYLGIINVNSWGFHIKPNTSATSYTLNGEIGAYDGSGTLYNTAGTPKTLYINTRPHITNYAFTKTSVKRDGIDTTDLVVTVKDYNGCANIAGGTVTADLSQLGLSSAEPLSYDSASGCQADGKTVYFKKIGISTTVPKGNLSFSSGMFTAHDADGNTNNSSDPNFGSTNTTDGNDFTTTIGLLVTDGPSVTFQLLSNSAVGGPSKSSTLFQFSASQSGSVRVSVGSDATCNGGVILQDWTATGSYTANTTTGVTIQATSLTEGANSIYACVKNINGDIGSTYVTVTKDTVAPTVGSFSLSPASVQLQDASVLFNCNENGTYQIERNGSGTLGSGIFIGSGSASANSPLSPAILNSTLVAGSNTIYAYCQDAASNIGSWSGTITKIDPAPSMSGSVLTSGDFDINYDGLDGRDFSITWNNSGGLNYGSFNSYRVYILPSNVSLNTATQTARWVINSAITNSWVGTSSITTDSTNAALVSGGSYKMCINILSTAGLYGTEGCGPAFVATADVVQHPTVLSARFTSDTNLELTTDATLSATGSNHSGALVSFTIGGTAYTGTSIGSVNGTKLNVTIPTLGGNLAATGTSLVLATGALNAAAGGFNNFFSSGSFAITDGQVPTIPLFSTGTVSVYQNFYSGSVVFNYSFGELMSSADFYFVRTGGNSDSTGTHIVPITNTNLTLGAHSGSIDLTTLGLVAGAYYDVHISGADQAGNIVTSSTISPIKFDNIGPGAPNITQLTTLGTLIPTFNWLAPTDNNGNGAGVKEYHINLYNGLACVSLNSPFIVSGLLSYTLSGSLTDRTNYSWNITAYDYLGNAGTVASCDDFLVDTTVPVISSQKITNTDISSVFYIKNGAHVSVTANISNTNSGNIFIDMQSLAGSATYSNVPCANPGNGAITCTYVWGIAIYSFIAGFAGSLWSDGTKQVSFIANNAGGINTQTGFTSITLDNTPPTSGTITAPTTGTVWGGTSQKIIWSGINDAISMRNIQIEYSSDTGSTWNVAYSGADISPYTWDITSLPSGNSNYLVRITGYDQVGNSSTTTSAAFSIDKVPPTITANVIAAPAASSNLPGGQSTTITWNSAGITDSNLAANPIALEYSTNSGANWTLIWSGLVNNGSYTWNVPGTTNTTTAQIRITATDAPGNSTTQTTANFIIDSTAPTLGIVYAGQVNGNTPPNGKHVNNSGIDITASATDTYLSGVTYTFQNLGNSQYWNGTTWTGTQVWNGLTCAAGVSCNVAQTINPVIVDSANYRLVIRVIDHAGNNTTANPIDYIGDTVTPNLTITTSTGTYFSGALTIAGTASDTGSSLSSIKIAIKKAGTSNWWNGTDWSSTSEQQLATTTANTYANWNYLFSPSGADSDGQVYNVTAYAYDRAYKTNNVSSGAINITLDKVGPTITSTGFWIEPPFVNAGTGGIMRGGQSATIRWSSGSIVDGLSGLAANPIKIEYWDGVQYQTITGATALPNTGSFAWTLPFLDTTSSLRVTASDAVGNTNAIISPTFVVDSTPPSIQKIETIGDGAGQIYGMNVYFSEILNTSTSLSGWTIPGSAITGIISSTNGAGTGTIIQLNFTATGTTASIPNVTYTQGVIADPAGNLLPNGTNTPLDKANPIITNASVVDNNTNGKIDRILVNWSESLSATNDASAWSLSSVLPGVSISSASTSGNTTTIVLSEPTAFDTSSGSMLLDFLSNANYHDSAANLANSKSNISLLDAATPIVTQAKTIDNSGVYAVDLTFSESVSGSTLTGFTLSGSATYTGTILQTAANTLRLITADSTATNTAKAYGLTYTASGSAIRDSSNNYLANFANMAVTDGVVPKILARTTLDTSHNGHIDVVRLDFSENIAGSLAGTTVTVGGYTSTGAYTISGSTLTVNLDESPSIDTSVTPTVQFQNTTLTDAAGNLAPSEGLGTAAVDGVGPVITNVRFDGTDTLALDFSEALSGSFNTGSFTLASATANIISVSVANGATTGTVTLNGSGITYGSSQISFAANSVNDVLNNKQSTTVFANISATAVINEVMWSSTGSSASQYIELRNLGSTPIDISGWKIDNAASNGTATLTIPASQTLAANGIYLITTSATAASLLKNSIVPDLVTATLSLSPTQAASLILKNASNSVYDRALASGTWPAGDNILPASMERKANPGNGLTAGNWYTAQTGSGFFDSVGPLGTPGGANVFDATAPTITASSPADNALYPLGTLSLTYSYTDNLSIAAAPAYTFKLEKNNGAGTFVDVTNASLTSSGVNGSNATFITNTLAYGHYRTTFTVDDAAGNTATRVSNFYVDAPSMTISAPTNSIGALQNGITTFGSTQVTVTVHTIGAGFTVALGGSGTMQAGTAQMAAWSGTTSNWFGFDYAASGSGLTKSYSNGLTAIANNTLDTVTFGTGNYTSGNGNMKTYTYTIKYGAQINALQVAGQYSANTSYTLNLNY